MVDRALQEKVSNHLDQREWKDAADGLGRLLEANPGDAGLRIKLSYVQSFMGRYRDARESAIAAAQAPPPTAEIARDVVTRLRSFNEAGEMRRYIVRLGPPARLPIPLLLGVAAQLSYMNDQSSALEWLDEAKRADPDYPGTILSRAQVLVYLGRAAEAKAELQRCLRVAPDVPELYRLLAKSRTATPDDNHADRIRGLLARPTKRPLDTVKLAYALHKELDDLGDFEGAWQALELGCRTMRATLRYEPSETRQLFSALTSFATSTRPWVVPTDAATPVFIVGMHRSGTTLLEQLLSGSPQVHGVGETYDFTSAMRYATDHHCKGVIDATIVQRAAGADFDEVGQRYLRGMGWRIGGKPFFTDKLPSNFLNIGFICEALPHARILHMVRDPVETCFSNLRELFSDASPYSYDQGELAAYFGEYRSLMAHWHAMYPGRILDVPYAELTRDPRAVMRRVAAFCGIDYIEEMSDPRNARRAVATASATQVRQGVSVAGQPKWKPYSDHLKPLLNAHK